MRALCLALLAVIACSDSGGPESHVIDAGAYTLALEGCFSCPQSSTPGIVATFGDGSPVIATLEVSAVTEAGAAASMTTIQSGGLDLSQFVDPPDETMEFGPAAGGDGYLGRWDYGDGLLTLVLRADSSCDVALFYPHPDAPGGLVDFGAGTCGVQ